MVDIFRNFVLCIVVVLFGCSAGISDKNVSFISPHDAAILVQEGNKHLLGPDSAAVIVDPRPTWEYRKSHIPESLNIPYGRLHIQLWRLNDVGTVIVSGETYNDAVAVAMSKSLMELGFKDVRTLRGGLLGWGDAGEPVEILE